MLAHLPFGQEFAWGDLGVVGLLIVLEGVLSIDNALVLGLLAKRLPKHQQPRALTYGLVGAFVFRILAISVASFLLKWRVVKLLGGGYLAYVAIKHLYFERSHDVGQAAVGAEGEPTFKHIHTGAELTAAEEEVEISERVPVPRATDIMDGRNQHGKAKFWPTVFVIEMTDIAFAVDSILAAIALVGPAPAGHEVNAVHPKLWVIITGGMLGVVLMRFAAVIFIRLLERFPRFEVTAYWLVFLIGLKLLIDWGFNTPEEPHRVDFHNFHEAPFWIFWIALVLTFLTGFLPKKEDQQGSAEADG
jgi:YkoY family integral membrane protein